MIEIQVVNTSHVVLHRYVYLRSLQEGQYADSGNSKRKRLYSKLISARKMLSDLRTQGSLGRTYTPDDVIYSTKDDDTEDSTAKYEKNEMRRFDKRLQN